MSDTPIPGETEGAPSNGQPAPVTPPQPDNAGGSDAEKLKEELARQARANQLANEELKKLREEKEARDKAEEERKAKELEANQEFKTLAEQEKAKREAAEAELEKREQEAELRAAKQDVLKDYPDEVQKQAEELGIDLTDADEADKFKEKLDKLNTAFQNTGRPSANNGRPNTNAPDTHTLLQDYAKGDDAAFDAALGKVPFIAENNK